MIAALQETNFVIFKKKKKRQCTALHFRNKPNPNATRALVWSGSTMTTRKGIVVNLSRRIFFYHSVCDPGVVPCLPARCFAALSLSSDTYLLNLFLFLCSAQQQQHDQGHL